MWFAVVSDILSIHRDTAYDQSRRAVLHVEEENALGGFFRGAGMATLTRPKITRGRDVWPVAEECEVAGTEIAARRIMCSADRQGKNTPLNASR